ncbi:hypothetical protein [Paenibacillus sp. SI8]|uniref:hypothetical protein n=1 Tax=unclassified Paenibacillus TaxID=185978 RepID=UPI0034674110
MQDIVQETLESMKDYVPRLAAASEQIAHDIQTHQAGWLDTLMAYLEGLDWLISAVNGIQRLDRRFLEGWNVELIKPLIDQMGEAMEQKDFVSLCDLLQYELRPTLESCENQLRGMVQ